MFQYRNNQTNGTLGLFENDTNYTDGLYEYDITQGPDRDAIWVALIIIM